MSDMLPPVIYELRAKYAEFVSGMRDAQKELAETGSVGEDTQARIDAATNKEIAASQRLAEAMAISTDSIKASIDEQIAKEQELATQMGADYDAEGRRAQLTATAVKSAAAEQIAAQKEAAAATRDLADANEEAAAKTDVAADTGGSAFMKYGKIAAAASIAAAGVVGVESLKMAMDFQKQTTLLETAGGESKKNMGIVTAGIKSLAVSTGTSTDQLAEGMYIAEKASYRGAAGLQVLKAAAQGAKAENVDLGTSVNALTDVMTDYHLSASKAAQAENMIVAASGRSKTTMQDFAGSLSAVVPLASSLHISFAQIGGAIATMTQHGQTAQQTTQNLSNLITNLAGQNSVAAGAMNQLGLNVTNIDKDLGTKGLTGTLGVITAEMAKNSKAGMIVSSTFIRSANATTALNTELAAMPPQLRAMSKAYDNGTMTYKDYYTATKSMGSSQYMLAKGFISTMAKAKGFNSQLTSGNATVRTTATEFQKLLGGVTGMRSALMLTGKNAKEFANNVDAVDTAGKKSGKNIYTWAQTQKTLAVQFSKLKEIIDVVAIDIGQKLIPIVTKIVSWVVKHKTVVIALTVALGGAALAFGVLTAAIWAINTAMDANPAVLIAAAIVAIGVGLYEAYQHCKPFRDAINDIWHVMVDWYDIAVKPIVQFFMHDWKIALGIAVLALAPFIAIPILIIKNWKTITRFFEALPGKLLGLLKDAGKWLVKIGTDIMNGLIDGIEFGAKLLWDWFVKLPIKVLEYFVKANEWLIGMGLKILKGLVGGIVTGAKKLWSWLGDLPGEILHILSDAGTWLVDVGKKMMEGLLNGIKHMAGSIAHGVKSVVMGAVHGIGSVASGIGGMLGLDTGGAVPGPVGAAVPAIVHGGEYMLSHGMLTGGAKIDPHVVQAVMSNVQKDKTALGALASAASYSGAAASGLSSGPSMTSMGHSGSFASSGSGGNTEIHLHIGESGVVIGSSHQFATLVKQAMLQAGAVNTSTYQNYRRTR